MKKELFNKEWKIIEKSDKSLVESMVNIVEKGKDITLPYDAMIRESVTKDTKNGGQTGYYPGKVYCYSKDFLVPKEWEEKTIILEFEGIYGQTTIYINGDYVKRQVYGYTSCFLSINDFLRYGEMNHIEVIVNNEEERNSRWYSGSGIYRDVQIYVGEKIFIPTESLKVSTPEIEKEVSVIKTEITIKNKDNKKHIVRVITEILDPSGSLVAKRDTPVTLYGLTSEVIEQRIIVENVELWSCDNPELYCCNVTIKEGDKIWDKESDTFGIRKLQLDSINGLRINGEEVKLRGACIHHDHGIIGASSFERAEERKIRKLKESGFNCIRMSHHPASKSLLRVCDRLGMLVMDELTDMWTRSKNTNDFANDFELYWEEITELMVRKDFNHPSVILYSMGNEIQEAGTAIGAKINRKIHQKIKSLDNTRYTTNAINGIIATDKYFMNIVEDVMKDMGISEMKSESNIQSNEQQKGSNELNSMMSIMVGPIADAISNHPIMTNMTEEFVEAMDIAGYNYLTGRHVSEFEKFPNRVVLGTETFPADIANLWRIVKENKHVIGDMTWAGYDYLGEAGVGIFHYDDGINFKSKFPERTAYIGDIDLIGNRKPISYYREIVYGLRKKPYIAVQRLNRYGEIVSRTPWMWKDNIESWTWPGYEGKPAIIDVMSDADEVELFLNGISKGRRKTGENNDYLAEFEINYEPGELKAVAIRDGIYCEEFSLITSENEVNLKVEVDKKELKSGGQDLAFIKIFFEDKNNVKNLYIKNEIEIYIEGCGSLEGFGSANPCCEKSYLDTKWETYDGYVMAVIRSGLESGEINVKIYSSGYTEEEIVFQVI